MNLRQTTAREAAIRYFWEKVVDETHAEYSAQKGIWTTQRISTISEELHCHICCIDGALMMLMDDDPYRPILESIYVMAQCARKDATRFAVAPPKWLPLHRLEVYR